MVNDENGSHVKIYNAAETSPHFWCRDHRMNMDINKLKSVRAGHRSATTRILRKLEEAEDKSELIAKEILVLVETLSEKRKTLVTFNERILEEISEENVEDEILETDEYHIMLDTKIKHYTDLTQKPHAITRNETILSTTESTSAPTMSFPTFQIHATH